ncbi:MULTISPECIES: hypothetical protein [Deefgea]|uniref:Uncharacterized protein n=1 Tax=Deefgea chitinilytica TaxID=570276 RepID=A0ABS2CGI3_9NEIS|nr:MULTISPECIES: hypothetical protein [Deefgea]MBM5572543.1 hypothetical protein [Deefgea chitinilytica]MBM9889779.1 hypothetical protein [Deefgea sp. CFH1-16]
MRYGYSWFEIAILGLLIKQLRKRSHMGMGATGRGVITGANDTYHGIQSLNENGAIKHSAEYARQLVTTGKAKSEDEALQMANQEIQRLRACLAGEQLNRSVRMALRAESQESETAPSFRTPSLQYP